MQVFLVLSMYFCLKNNKDLYLFIYLLPLRPVGKFQLQQYGGLECNKLYLASAIEDKLKVTTKH